MPYETMFVNHIRKALFVGEDVENYAPATQAGGCLANLTEPSNTKRNTNRRGQRQKWSDRSSSSHGGSLTGMSMLADIDDNANLSSRNSTRRISKAAPNGVSVLVSVEDNGTLASERSSRHVGNTGGANGGLLSLFGAHEQWNGRGIMRKTNGPRTTMTSMLRGSKEKAKKRKDVKILNRPERRAITSKPRSLGLSLLLSAEAQNQSEQGCDHSRHCQKAIESLDSMDLSVMTTEPNERLKQRASKTIESGIVDSSLLARPPSKFSDNNEWPMVSSNATGHRKSAAARGKYARKRSDLGSTILTSSSSPTKRHEEDAFMMSQESPGFGKTKDSKRKDTKRTPSKLDSDLMGMEDAMRRMELLKVEDELPLMDEDMDTASFAGAVSKPPQDPTENNPAKTSCSSQREEPTDLRRSSRRQLVTDRFSPSLAMKQNRQKEARTSKKSVSFPALSPSDKETEALIQTEDVAQMPRRSARGPIPTSFFSPSVAMKESQLKSSMSQGCNANTKSSTKSTLKKQLGQDLPPRHDSKSSVAAVDSSAAQTAQIVNNPSETASSRPKIESSVSCSDVWTEEQLVQLKKWQSEVNPMSFSFWADIAEHVDEKSAQECREKWFSLVKTPAPRAKKPSQKDAEHNAPAVAAATTIAMDEDDIFNSTPMRGNLFPNDTKSQTEYDEIQSIDFDIGSPFVMSLRPDRRVSTEYDDGEQHLSLEQKVGYKSYLLGLKRGMARAQREKKAAKQKQTVVNSVAYKFSESVGNGDISLKCQLSPGGTLSMMNYTEPEDDFMDCHSDMSDCDM